MPNEAPQALKDFVACVAVTVDIDTESLGWLPSGGLGDAAPSITMTPGASSTEANVGVGWDFFAVNLPASIGATGELVVDTSNIPGIASGVKDGIDKWVEAFNATMIANGKRLDRFDITGTTVTITKRAIAAGPPTEPVVSAPATGAAVTSGGTTTAPQPEPKGPQRGCLAWALGVIAVVGTGLGIFVATRGGDTDDVATSVVATDSPTATDVATATDGPTDTAALVPPTDAVATDAPPPATTEPPPSTTEPALDPDEVERRRILMEELQQMADDSVMLPLFQFPKAGAFRTIDCNTGTPVENLGPEILGIVGVGDGESNELFVLPGLAGRDRPGEQRCPFHLPGDPGPAAGDRLGAVVQHAGRR